MLANRTRTAPALYKALYILELLTSSRTGLTLSELVLQANMAKSSVHYLLVTLERCGYVCRCTRTGRYMLGVKLFSMASSAPGSLGLRLRTAPYLSGLRMRTCLTVHLAILEQTDVVLIGKHETSRGDCLATWVGKRMDLHCTAVGKAILAFLPESQIDFMIRKHGLGRHNEKTIATPKRLYEELESVAKDGFALNNEENVLGVRCIGVPIFSPQGSPIAAISVAGPTSEIELKDVPRLSRELVLTANAIRNDVVESMAVA